MKNETFSKEDLIHLMPQKKPFLFIDEILEVDENKIVGKYQFKSNEFYYAGHFPHQPITPGVILLESMAQVGVVALGLYLLSHELKEEELVKYVSLFSDGSIELYSPVFPEDSVVVRGEKMFWRQRKLRSKVEMYRGDTLVASCVVAGVGVKR